MRMKKQHSKNLKALEIAVFFSLLLAFHK